MSVATDAAMKYNNMLQQTIVDYAGDLSKQINQPGPNDEAGGHMSMLQASLTDEVRQGYQQLADDKAKQQELLRFIVDLEVAGLPISKWTSSGIKKVLSEMFGNNPKLQEALKTPLEQMFDKTTGKLTDAGKKDIVDALGQEEGNLEIAKNAANSLVGFGSFMNQIEPHDYARGKVESDYNLIMIGIGTIRAKK